MKRELECLSGKMTASHTNSLKASPGANKIPVEPAEFQSTTSYLKASPGASKNAAVFVEKQSRSPALDTPQTHQGSRFAPGRLSSANSGEELPRERGQYREVLACSQARHHIKKLPTTREGQNRLVEESARCFSSADGDNSSAGEGVEGWQSGDEGTLRGEEGEVEAKKAEGGEEKDGLLLSLMNQLSHVHSIKMMVEQQHAGGRLHADGIVGVRGRENLGLAGLVKTRYNPDHPAKPHAHLECHDQRAMAHAKAFVDDHMLNTPVGIDGCGGGRFVQEHSTIRGYVMRDERTSRRGSLDIVMERARSDSHYRQTTHSLAHERGQKAEDNVEKPRKIQGRAHTYAGGSVMQENKARRKPRCRPSFFPNPTDRIR